MRCGKLLPLTLVLMSCSQTASHCYQDANHHAYHLVETTPIGGNGGWDYVKVDSENRRVYVTHTNQVEVLDADSGKQVGVIDGLHGVHGIALSKELGKGFITNGASGSVTVFELETLDVIGEVKTGKKPDSIASDDMTHRALAFNGDSNSATVIDEKKMKKVGTIALGAGPEFAVPDDKGHIFVNLEDTDETLMLDVLKLKVMKRWKVSPGGAPSSIALDRQNHRLFVGCRNRKLVVLNADTGKVVASLPIGDHVDATAYDPQMHAVISSAGDGTVTVIKQDDADHYHIAQTIITQKGSKTFGLDKKTHRLFVPAADFGPAPRPSKDNPKGRPPVIAGTFKMLVYAPLN